MSGVRLKLLFLAVLSVLFLDRASPLVAGATGSPSPHALTKANALARLPVQFTANDGQWGDSIRFVGRKGATQVALTDDGATVLVRTPATTTKGRGKHAKHQASAPIVVGMKVAGGRAVTPRASNVLEGKSNYYLGSDPSKWRSGVSSFARVEYPSVKDGVDLVYHGENGALEYDFVVAPGTPVDGLAMEVVGASELSLDDKGDLRIHTPRGDIKQPRPVVYQRTPGGQKEIVAASYQLVDKTKIGFLVASYDAKRELVIDPTVNLGSFGYSTLIGGTNDDGVDAISVDLSGNAYVTGFTYSSSGFPIVGTPAYQTTLGDNGESFGSDAFVTKLNPAGTDFLYSTYFGGTSYDEGFGIAVDGSGRMFITGYTDSSDFPTTTGAYCESFDTFEEAAYAARFEATGTLGYSTLLTGTGDTFSEGNGIAVDTSGNAYVAGHTDANDFPVTTPVVTPPGDDDDVVVPQPPPNGLGNLLGNRAFIVKVGSTGTSLGYHLFVDGNGSESASAVALDPGNQAFIVGDTSSTDIGTPTCTGNNALLAKVNLAGNGFDFVRCFGGGFTEANGVAVNTNGEAYVVGETDSSNFPTTPGAWQTSGPDEDFDGFLAKFNATGTITFATYLGGTGDDSVNGVALDQGGNIWLAGQTGSSDFTPGHTNPPTPIFPPTPGGFCGKKRALLGQPVVIPEPPIPVQQVCDAWFGRLNATGATLGLFTYLGGGDTDGATSIAVQATSVFAAGFTEDEAADFPVTEGAADTNSGETEEGFIAKIGVAPLFINPPQVSLATGGAQAFSPSGGVGFGYTFEIFTDNSGGATITPDGHYTAGPNGGGPADVVILTDGAGLTAFANIAVNAGGTGVDLVIQPANTAVTPKGQRFFTASGGTPPYTFSFASNASIGAITPAGGYTAGPTGNVTDIVRVTDAIGNSRTATISVSAGILIAPAKPTAPPGGSVNFSATGGSGGGYLWSISKNTSGATIVQATGRYTAGSSANAVDTVKVVDSLGNSATVQVSVGGGLAVNPDAPNVTTKGVVEFTAIGGSGSYSWQIFSNLSGGTIDAATGAYQAGPTGDVVDLVKVTDTLGKSAVAQVTVGPALTITPTAANTLTGGKVSFTAAGGSGSGYAFTIPTNQSGGSIDGSGVYTAGGAAGSDTVHLADSLGNGADATIHVTLAPSSGGGGGSGAGNGNGTSGNNNNPAGLNLAGGAGNDDCNCRAAGAASSVPSTPRLLAGLALALGLVIRRRRRRG